MSVATVFTVQAGDTLQQNSRNLNGCAYIFVLKVNIARYILYIYIFIANASPTRFDRRLACRKEQCHFTQFHTA